MQKILQDAGREARFGRCVWVEPMHILLSMLRQERTAAKELLTLNSVNVEELFTRTVETLQVKQGTTIHKEANKTKLLEQFSEDLVQKVSSMAPVIGRDREIEQVISILCRKHKNNPAIFLWQEYFTCTCPIFVS